MVELVIILNGHPRTGKDTVGEMFQKIANPNSVGIISTVGPVKEAARALGCDCAKTDNNRKMLHELKMLWTEYMDGSFNYITNTVKHSKAKVMCVMAREVDEIDRFKKFFESQGIKCRSLLVKREGVHVPDNFADSQIHNYADGREYIYNDVFNNINGPEEEWQNNMCGFGVRYLTLHCPSAIMMNLDAPFRAVRENLIIYPLNRDVETVDDIPERLHIFIDDECLGSDNTICVYTMHAEVITIGGDVYKMGEDSLIVIDMVRDEIIDVIDKRLFDESGYKRVGL